jgi:hypothetical protein
MWSAWLSETARFRFAPPLVLRGGANVLNTPKIFAHNYLPNCDNRNKVSKDQAMR